MDTNKLLSKLNSVAPGMILEKSRFGRQGPTCVWIDCRGVREVARFLKNDSELQLDWLENFSVAEVSHSLVFTYFVRSTLTEQNLIIRGSLPIEQPDLEVELNSIADIWLTAEPFEREASELFGVNFLDAGGGPMPYFSQRLPAGWMGFPLRKEYRFPPEFGGIVHSRPAIVSDHSIELSKSALASLELTGSEWPADEDHAGKDSQE